MLVKYFFKCFIGSYFNIVNFNFMQGILLVYDIINIVSFENVEDWYSCVKKVFGKDSKMLYLVLVGNKSKC